MNQTFKISRILFGIPWIIFGIQHFMYADFVATLVPAFMPLKIVWVYLTGAAMIAAGISLIVNKISSTAAMLLSLMLWTFVLLVHIPALSVNPAIASAWARPLQDILLACAAFLLANALSNRETQPSFFKNFAKFSRYLFAVMLILIGVQQFFNLDFVTARIPNYVPFRLFWVYLTGILMAITGVSVIVNKKARLAAFGLGFYLLVINLLNHVYLLANDVHQPILWTAAMLDLAVTAGVFILANDSPAKD